MASGIVGVSSSDDDDLWGYGGAEEPSEDQQTPGDGQDDDDDGLECYLPEHKRAKLALQRKARRAGTIHDLDEVLVIDDDEEGPNSSKAAQPLVSKRTPVDDDDWLDCSSAALTTNPSARHTDPLIAEILRRNSEAVESLEQASKEATITIGDLDEPDDDCVLLENKGASVGTGAPPQTASAEVAQKVTLCLRCAKDRQVKLRIARQGKQHVKNEPIEKLIDPFRKHAADKGWTMGPVVKFVFDGEVLAPSTTPLSLDCEDDDVIDVHC